MSGFFRPLRLPHLARLALAAVVLCPPGARAQSGIRPSEISAAQTAQAPYRHTGRLYVYEGKEEYAGTASYIRRYTGLTAGHMLYSPAQGFSTDLQYVPALYQQADSYVKASYLAVLAGYQTTADEDRLTDAGFERDMGYVLFTQPAAGNEWAPWSADPTILTQSTNNLIIGYAADSFSGYVQAQVQTRVPYTLRLAPGLYENTSYYSEEGMSGGPVYATADGVARVVAVTVAGDSPPHPASSGVRAITADEGTLFTNAEYVHGLVTGGKIAGPTSVPQGGTAKFKTAVVFTDGAKDSDGFAARYDDVELATYQYRKQVQITKLKPGKYKVAFAPNLTPGAVVPLMLIRSGISRKYQEPLATWNVRIH